MDSGLIVRMIKDLLKKAIQKYAKQLQSSDQEVDLLISAKNAEAEPQIHVYNKGVLIKEIQVTDLYSTFDSVALIAKAAGFDLKLQIPKYLTQFILRVSNEKGIDVKTPAFGIMLIKENLYALLYIEGKNVRFSDEKQDIPLEYILETK